MIWQDIALSVGGILFTVALIPTVRSRTFKPTPSTCILTGTVLTVYVVVYITLSFWFSATVTTSTSILWWILAYQSKQLGKGVA